MARKKNPLLARRTMPNEDMVVSGDSRSMRKGRRAAPRTEVCRPCLVWPAEADPAAVEKTQGVVLDLNPHGMRIRALDPYPAGTVLAVQMMRDEEYQIPLSAAIEVRVIRVTEADGFHDHGVRLVLKRIRRVGEVRLQRPAQPRPVRRLGTRMHTVDYSVDDDLLGRTRR